MSVRLSCAQLRVSRSDGVYQILRRVFEVCSSGGVRAANSGGGAGVMSVGGGLDRADAARVLESFMFLDSQWVAAMNCAIFCDDIRRGPAAADDAIPFVCRALEAVGSRFWRRWGRFGVSYFVNYWVSGSGSFRGFSRLCEAGGFGPVDPKTVAVWCVDVLDLLDLWAMQGEAALFDVCKNSVSEVLT